MAKTQDEFLEELRNRVAEKRKQLEEEEQALHVLERMLNNRLPSNSSPTTEEKKTEPTKKIGLFGRGLPDIAQRKSLAENVREIIPLFGESEFTVAHIEKSLEKNGVKISGQSPRARIAMVLSSLEEKGEVVRTFRGTGSTPHRFKVSKNKQPDWLS